MKIKVIFILAILFSASILQADNKPVKIVTTTSDLASITKSITGETAIVSCIANGSQDPHFIDARPGYIVQARKADVWIRIGLELEIGWEPPILKDSRNNNIQVSSKGHIDTSENVIKLEVPSVRVTRDMGDVHAHGNPHYWLDPLNGRIMAKTIADRLSELYPDMKQTYQANLKEFQLELDSKMFGNTLVNKYGGAKIWSLMLKNTLDEIIEIEGKDSVGGWYGKMTPYKGDSIVTYHKSWIYFTERFGLKTPIELEPKPGIPPTAKHLQNVKNTIETQNIKVILQEPFYSQKSAELLSRKTNATLVVCPNSVNDNNSKSTYLNMIDNIVNKLSDKL